MSNATLTEAPLDGLDPHTYFEEVIVPIAETFIPDVERQLDELSATLPKDGAQMLLADLIGVLQMRSSDLYGT